MVLETAFCEPVYERLHLKILGKDISLLAFTRPIAQFMRDYLTRVGAKPCQSYRAECYPEIWEFSPKELAKSGIPLTELDLTIANGLKVHDGKYPWTAGYWAHRSPSASSSHLLSACQRSGSFRISK